MSYQVITVRSAVARPHANEALAGPAGRLEDVR